MNYDVYRVNLKDICVILGKAIGVTCMFSYLFYQSIWGFIMFPAIVVFFYKAKKKGEIEKRKKQLHEHFIDCLKAVNTCLLAGYSMENAWREAEKEIKDMYGTTTCMSKELEEMNRLIQMNVPMENALSDFANRTGVDDVISFSEVFAYGKRSGGNWKKIIEDTTYRIEEKFEATKEIEVMLAAKRLEQKIMNVIPLFMIMFLQLASGDYMDVLYGNVLGVLCMSTCLLGYVVALYLAHRILKIKV